MASDTPTVPSVPDAISDTTRPTSVFQTTDAVLAKLVQNSPIAIVVSTLADGQMLAVNDSFLQLFGYTRDEVIGQTSTELGMWTDPGQRAELTAALVAGAPLRDFEATIRTKSGTERQVLAAVSEVTIDGRACLLTQLYDVTAHRQAEQFKDDFLALISHELRTPLSAIHGGARVLLTKPHLDDAMRAELLTDVIAESERLDRLLSNLLALTSIMAGRLRASLEPVLMEPLARRISHEIGARSPAHTFVVDAAPDLPPANADPNLLEEVLRNLYENAVKYAPQGGPVRTTVVAEGDTIVTRVTDEGIGIASEHLTTVFERFRRVGGDSMVRVMGPGLYLCRGLVEAQGGRIKASSPGLGHGATFTVTLSIAEGWAASAHP